MRPLATAFVALVALGCNPPLPEGAVESDLTGTTTAAQPCITFCSGFGYGESAPTDNPWAGLPPGYVFSGPGFGNIVVYGLDATMTTWVWERVVVDEASVAYYRSLPGTIPFECPKTIEVGQVGSSNTKTGGGNENCWQYCIDQTAVTNLAQQCSCESAPAATTCSDAGIECGTTTDTCKNVVNCGRCTVGVCTKGQCVIKGPPPPACHGTTCI